MIEPIETVRGFGGASSLSCYFKNTSKLFRIKQLFSITKILKVETPCENLPELEYILSVILEDILGFSWCLVPKDIDLLKLNIMTIIESYVTLKLFPLKTLRVYQKYPCPLSKWDGNFLKT